MSDLVNSNLFKPIRVGRDELKTKIVLAPLTRSRAPNSIINEYASKYYSERGAFEGTLLISEATFITPQAGGMPLSPGIWKKDQIAAWKKVTDAVHAKGSFIYCQILALGRQSPPSELEKHGYPLVSASDVPLAPGDKRPRPLTKEEIKQYVDWHAQAAKNAVEAGFDGIELHGAYGYLLDQFLHENTNHRTDEYGGSIENRARFPLEVVDAVVAAIGADRVGYRISPWGEFGAVDPGVSPVPQWSYFLAELQRRANEGKELAYVHIIEPRVNHRIEERATPHELNDFVRNVWEGVLIRCGSFCPDLTIARKLVDADDKLLIGVGRYFISNPDLVQKLHDGTPLVYYYRPFFYWDGTSIPIDVGYTRDYTKEDVDRDGYGNVPAILKL